MADIGSHSSQPSSESLPGSDKSQSIVDIGDVFLTSVGAKNGDGDEYRFAQLQPRSSFTDVPAATLQDSRNDRKALISAGPESHHVRAEHSVGSSPSNEKPVSTSTEPAIDAGFPRKSSQDENAIPAHDNRSISTPLSSERRAARLWFFFRHILRIFSPSSGIASFVVTLHAASLLMYSCDFVVIFSESTEPAPTSLFYESWKFPRPWFSLSQLGGAVAVLTTFLIFALRRMIYGGVGGVHDYKIGPSAATNAGSRHAGAYPTISCASSSAVRRAGGFFFGVFIIGFMSGFFLVPAMRSFRRTSSWVGVLDPSLLILFFAEIVYSLSVCVTIYLMSGSIRDDVDFASADEGDSVSDGSLEQASSSAQGSGRRVNHSQKQRVTRRRRGVDGKLHSSTRVVEGAGTSMVGLEMEEVIGAEATHLVFSRQACTIC